LRWIRCLTHPARGALDTAEEKPCSRTARDREVIGDHSGLLRRASHPPQRYQFSFRRLPAAG
jgi:hypothetical protein